MQQLLDLATGYTAVAGLTGCLLTVNGFGQLKG
jgi:hypothetical protein